MLARERQYGYLLRRYRYCHLSLAPLAAITAWHVETIIGPLLENTACRVLTHFPTCIELLLNRFVRKSRA